MKEMATILFTHQIFLVLSLSLWQNAQGESLTLLQYPSTIMKNYGESATIYCVLSKVNFTDHMCLVWYKYTSGNKIKVGEIRLKTSNISANDQIQLLWNLDTNTAIMSIQQLKKNDSGTYGCELLSVADFVNIEKANTTKITVNFTEGQQTASEQINSTKNVTELSKKGKIEIIVAAVIAAFVIICILIFILIRYRPKKQDPNPSPPTADAECQKPNDRISTVFSIDYAVLQVPGKNIRQNLTTSVASDDSYYATIIFAPE
ncbi:programmed cell death protein 1 isoform X2 [Amblyraja radiata]|uniref:programmed cell death protein 1 isoform X2 n=1 Tax=Amblyraja radiata TaxID=386614 RepID=UPI0014028C2B|nr:programmed cell death protein 1 isoform X2 [Amblyraja radiata]